MLTIVVKLQVTPQLLNKFKLKNVSQLSQSIQMP